MCRLISLYFSSIWNVQLNPYSEVEKWFMRSSGAMKIYEIFDTGNGSGSLNVQVCYRLRGEELA